MARASRLGGGLRSCHTRAMSRDFKMHRAAKARASVAPLKAGPAQRVTRDALEQAAAGDKPPAPSSKTARAEEIGGPKGPEPTRYGDWERNGICVDF